MKPTPLSATPKVGDTVRCLGQTMQGIVKRVVPMHLPYAVVDWGQCIGRHSITTLEVVK